MPPGRGLWCTVDAGTDGRSCGDILLVCHLRCSRPTRNLPHPPVCPCPEPVVHPIPPHCPLPPWVLAWHSKAHRWADDDLLDDSNAEMTPTTSTTSYLDAVRWEPQPLRTSMLPERARPHSIVMGGACGEAANQAVAGGLRVGASTIVGHDRGSSMGFLSLARMRMPAAAG